MEKGWAKNKRRSSSCLIWSEPCFALPLCRSNKMNCARTTNRVDILPLTVVVSDRLFRHSNRSVQTAGSCAAKKVLQANHEQHIGTKLLHSQLQHTTVLSAVQHPFALCSSPSLAPIGSPGGKITCHSLCVKTTTTRHMICTASGVVHH